jgi:alanyl-tRNA synthetase
MGDVFTELKEHEKKITDIIKEEEASFCKTLAKVRAGFNFRQSFEPLILFCFGFFWLVALK